MKPHQHRSRSEQQSTVRMPHAIAARRATSKREASNRFLVQGYRLSPLLASIGAMALAGACGSDTKGSDGAAEQETAGAGGALDEGGDIVLDSAGTGSGTGGTLGDLDLGAAGTPAGAAGAAAVPACGDSLVNQSSEQCDDGDRDSGDGCTAECRVEANYLCATPGEPCVTTKVCGDAGLVGDEECDDGNTEGGDGCGASCTLEAGYVCPLPGTPCAEVCGDSLVKGIETCDDGNTASGDGCSEVCLVEEDAELGANGSPSYWVCVEPGQACERAACADGAQEGAEPCDDGNDRPGDGCSPQCEVEPRCTLDGCVSQCGDGIILPGDAAECDDGNSLDGDGCTATCEVEPGYTCERATSSLSDVLTIPIVYRDFVGAQRALPSAPVHPDFESTRGVDRAALGLVEDRLSSAGVPVLTGLCVGAPEGGLLTGATDSVCPEGGVFGSNDSYRFNQMSSDEAFAQWFEDAPEVNRTIVSRLCLKRQEVRDTFVFDSSTDDPTDCGPAVTCAEDRCWFLPINGQGFVDEGLEIDNLDVPDVFFGSPDPEDLEGNFSFTSVIRTWFTYQGGERLEFSGDDDVWVFINGKLAVDIGGLHAIVDGGVTLDATQAAALGLATGRVYEIALFHAERYGYGSNFKLTLGGFTTARSECASVCGDGVRVGREACDDGEDNIPAGSADSYGRCTDRCELGPRCGDGIRQADAGEECDEPSAQRLYTETPNEGCTPACKRPGFCGDGVLQTSFEDCDDGSQNSADSTAYGKCTTGCELGPHCGDGIQNGTEECDAGDANGDGRCGIACVLLDVY